MNFKFSHTYIQHMSNKHTSLSPNGSRALLYSPPHSPTTVIEVTTVYFRAGYDPTHYTHNSAWAARLRLEASRWVQQQESLVDSRVSPD